MLRISLTDRQAEQLLNYYDLLIKKNKVMNLTAITEFEEVLCKHFIEYVLTQAFESHPVKNLFAYSGNPLKLHANLDIQPRKAGIPTKEPL